MANSASAEVSTCPNELASILRMIAGRFDCELLRTYRYVVEHLDCRPYKVPHGWAEKERVLSRWFAARIQACSSQEERRHVLKSIEQELLQARAYIESRARGWRETQSSIENHNDQLEFRRSGSITYELATKQFGVEKGVDTQLAADMIARAAQGATARQNYRRRQKQRAPPSQWHPPPNLRREPRDPPRAK